jgi:NAD(P)-dependent dehydrogenase (short-subunit alcohol dehydrogenase family)
MSEAAEFDATRAARYPSLHGVPVFVTGGASGIGADIVRAFARQGAKVGFVDIDAAGAELLRASLGDAATPPLFTRGDVTRIDELRAAVQATRAAFGDIGVLVNNVANDQRHDFAAVDVAGFDATVAVNLRPAFFAAQAVVPDMKRRGHGAIVNIGSASWLMKSADLTVYATCKSAMMGFTRTLASQLGRDRIRVNQVIPGWVMTDKQLKLWVDAEGEQAMDRNQLLPGRLQGHDIASMVLFLAADDSRMITAQGMLVDAGWV